MKQFIMLPYGAVLDGSSKDFDAIPCPSGLMPMLTQQQTHQIEEIKRAYEGKQMDIVYPTHLRAASHGYWNLHHDYGESFADEWWEAMGLDESGPMSIDLWMRENIQQWEQKLRQQPHPRIWGKWMFARLQHDAYIIQKGMFTNRKKELLEYLRHEPRALDTFTYLGELPKSVKDARELLASALEDILMNGDDFSDNVKELLSLEIEREIDPDTCAVDMQVSFCWGEQFVGTFEGSLEIDVWSESSDDVQTAWAEQEEFFVPKIERISSGDDEIEYDTTRTYWDGYGL